MGNTWASLEDSKGNNGEGFKLSEKMKHMERNETPSENHEYYAIRFLIKHIQIDNKEIPEIVNQLINEFNPNLVYAYPSEIIMIFDRYLTNERMGRKYDRALTFFSASIYSRNYKNVYPRADLVSFPDFATLSLYLYWKILLCIQENVHESARCFVNNTNGLKLDQMKEIIKCNDIPWESYEPAVKYGIFYKKTKRALVDKNGRTYYRTCEPTQISYNPHEYKDDELYDLFHQEFNVGL